jgi:DNA-binding NarL/FixJ family response regulator
VVDVLNLNEVDITTSPEKIRVLIVDGHKMFADSLAIRLSAELDLDVIGCVFDASTGIREAGRTQPDVAIVGYPFPDRDGISAAAAMLDISPTTRALVLASLPDESLLVAAMDAGCCGFITKEEDTAELVAAVRLVAAGAAYIPSQLISKLIPRLSTNYRAIGADLTTREREVLVLLAAGTTTAGIASQLFVSVNTIRQHVQRILGKLSAHSKLEAVAIAVREGVIARSL